MAVEQHLLSTEIVNRGIESSGPDAGSLTYFVRVCRRLPDFVQSVNLKYVINHGIYLATILLLVLIFNAEVGSLSMAELWRIISNTARYDLATVMAFLGIFVFIILNLEIDERAKEADIRVHELEEQNKLSEDSHLYEYRCEKQMAHWFLYLLWEVLWSIFLKVIVNKWQH